MISAHTLTATIPGMLFFAFLPAAAQPKPIDLGQLGMVTEHAAWPAPESIVRDLRSSNDDIRLKALSLAGVTEQLRGNDAVRPSQIELRHAALGSDATQQAILAVQMGDYGFAVVVTPKGNAWERVAQFYLSYARLRLAA
jgi:hypothetical protein